MRIFPTSYLNAIRIAAAAVLIALLSAEPSRAQLNDISGIRVGDSIQVFFGDKWLPATVVELHNGYLRATFTDERQYPTTLTENFQPIFLRHPPGHGPVERAGLDAAAPGPAPAPVAEKRADAPAPTAPPVTPRPPDSVAQNVPVGPTDFVGEWILNSPGVASWSKTVEEDWSVNLEITTHTFNVGVGAKGMGAVRIAPDGTYRMAFLGDKWTGRWWPSQDGRGGIHLDHPGDATKSWHFFVAAEDGLPRALCATCTGESYQKLERIPPELAEQLVTPTDARQLVGRWNLWFQKWESGFVEINADGTYRLEADGQKAEGRWAADGEDIRFPGAFGRDGWLKLRNGNPNEAVLIGAISEYRALRR